MMLDRDKMNFWVRFVAIGLAVVFVGSSVFLGIGTGVNYSLTEVFGGGNNDQQAGQTVNADDQIQTAKEELDENPEGPDAIVTLATLYVQDRQLEEAEKVLEDGREAAPKEENIPMILGEVYYRQAQSATKDEQKKLYAQAGDAYASATQLDKENEDAYLAAGGAYDEADQPSEAIKYWNTYLELEPDGEQSDAVEERISTMLEGGMTTGGSGGGSNQP